MWVFWYTESNKTLNYVQIDSVGHYARTRSESSHKLYNYHLDLGHITSSHTVTSKWAEQEKERGRTDRHGSQLHASRGSCRRMKRLERWHRLLLSSFVSEITGLNRTGQCLHENAYSKGAGTVHARSGRCILQVMWRTGRTTNRDIPFVSFFIYNAGNTSFLKLVPQETSHREYGNVRLS